MYQVPEYIDKNKIFIVQRSEINGRLDPKMALFGHRVRHSLYPKVQLKDLIVCKPQYGAGESGKPRKKYEEPRYIRITDIDEYGLISDSDLGAKADIVEEKYLLNKDDILIARSGATVGKAYIHRDTPYRCYYAGYLIRFIVNHDKVLPDYVFAYTQLNTYKEWVNAIQRPSAQPNINAEEYQSLEIPLPDKEKQQEIANIINSAYALKHRKESEAQRILNSIDTYLLEELGITLPETRTDLGSRMFIVNFKDVTGGRLDAEYQFCDLDCKSSKYDSLPLGRIVNFQKGTAMTSKDIIRGDVPVIAGGKTSPYLHNEANFKGNVITVSASGAYAGYVWYHEHPIFATDCTVIWSKDEDAFSTKYIYEVLKTLQPVIYGLQVGAAQPHVYPSDLMSVNIPILTPDKQKLLVDFSDRQRQQAKALQSEGKAILENAKREVEKMIIGA